MYKPLCFIHTDSHGQENDTEYVTLILPYTLSTIMPSQLEVSEAQEGHLLTETVCLFSQVGS